MVSRISMLTILAAILAIVGCQKTDAITAKYKAIDNADAAFFDQRRTDFTAALQPFQTRIAEIKQKFSGADIGSTESIFVYMAAALTLMLLAGVTFAEPFRLFGPGPGGQGSFYAVVPHDVMAAAFCAVSAAFCAAFAALAAAAELAF